MVVEAHGIPSGLPCPVLGDTRTAMELYPVARPATSRREMLLTPTSFIGRPRKSEDSYATKLWVLALVGWAAGGSGSS